MAAGRAATPTAMSYPASKHSHFDLVPGHQNTTTKEPMLRPPDMRLVTAMAPIALGRRVIQARLKLVMFRMDSHK